MNNRSRYLSLPFILNLRRYTACGRCTNLLDTYTYFFIFCPSQEDRNWTASDPDFIKPPDFERFERDIGIPMTEETSVSGPPFPSRVKLSGLTRGWALRASKRLQEAAKVFVACPIPGMEQYHLIKSVGHFLTVKVSDGVCQCQGSDVRHQGMPDDANPDLFYQAPDDLDAYIVRLLASPSLHDDVFRHLPEGASLAVPRGPKWPHRPARFEEVQYRCHYRLPPMGLRWFGILL